MDLVSKKALIENKVKEIGYELVSISSKKEKGTLTISIVVDRVTPIDMNAIVEVSNTLSSYFDEIDDGQEPYTLDVSSLGAEKPLKKEELSSYIGRYVHVSLINASQGMNIIEGFIEEVKEDHFVLSYRIKTRVKHIDIYLNNIYNIRLAIKF